MEYHGNFMGDTLYNSDAVGRISSYYGITGYPTAKFDGQRQVVGGGTPMFGYYLNAYTMEMLTHPSSCTLNIFVDYNESTRFLKVKARATKVDTFSNARLRYAIAESHIYRPWGGLDSLHHVVRKMLPNFQGIVVPNTLLIGQSFVDSQTYTLDSKWKDENCYVVVFVQDDDSPKKVLRSAKSGLFPTWVYGDATGDGIVDIADVIYLINYAFVNGPRPNPLASGDANYDCVINVADIIYLINYSFIAGPPPLKGCAW